MASQREYGRIVVVRLEDDFYETREVDFTTCNTSEIILRVALFRNTPGTLVEKLPWKPDEIRGWGWEWRGRGDQLGVTL